jgi:hypothetical protein
MCLPGRLPSKAGGQDVSDHPTRRDVRGGCVRIGNGLPGVAGLPDIMVPQEKRDRETGGQRCQQQVDAFDLSRTGQKWFLSF